MAMTEQRTLIWGLVHGKPVAQVMYGNPLSPAGKSLIEEAFYKVLGTFPLMDNDFGTLNELKEKYPCPEIKDEQQNPVIQT